MICRVLRLRPDELMVDVFVRMPARSGVLQPVVGLAAGGVDSPVEDHLHPPVRSVRQLPWDLVLELLLSGVKVNSSMIPARPNSVIYAEEHHHVFAKTSQHISYQSQDFLPLIELHHLHCPQREDVFLVEENPWFLTLQKTLDIIHS